MNSINWARVMAQIVYYVTAAAAVAPGGGPVSFAVPTGNFGNVLAGWVAQRDGRADRAAASSAATATTSSPAGSTPARSSTERGRADAQPEHGHPGVVATSSACCSSCSAATARAIAELMARFRGRGLASTAPPADCRAVRRRPASTTTRRSQVIADVYAARRLPRSTRTPRSASARPAAAPARRDGADGVPGHRPPGQVPRRGRGGHRHPARAARRTWPTCSTGPSATTSLANDLDAVRRTSRPSHRRADAAAVSRTP